MSTSNGYTSFFDRSSTYDSGWGNISGARHKIYENDNDEHPSDRPPQSHDNPRELHDNLRKLHPIPFQDKDLEPLKTRPIPSDFNIKHYKEHLEDPDVATVFCQQARLSTFHEQLGNLSFHLLILLARALIIPKEKSSEDAPIFPGLTYGKSHCKPTRRKGVNNKKYLRTTTALCQVVSIY